MPANLSSAQNLPQPPASMRVRPGEPLFADAVGGAFLHLQGQAPNWIPLALDHWSESNAEGVTVATAERIRAMILWEERGSSDGDTAPPLHLLYCIILLAGVGILHMRNIASDPEMVPDGPTLMEQLEPVFADCIELMLRKNHDYGDSWRYMRIPSITDQMLVKILRLQQLEELEAQGSQGQVAEGRESEFKDILNYAILELLRYTTLRETPPWPLRLHSQPLIPFARG